MNRRQRADIHAWGLWATLVEMDEEERIELLEDKKDARWRILASPGLAAWVCSDLDLLILPNGARFEGVPVIRLHNFYKNARAIGSREGMLAYRDNWTMRHNPKAFDKLKKISRDLWGAA